MVTWADHDEWGYQVGFIFKLFYYWLLWPLMLIIVGVNFLTLFAMMIYPGLPTLR